MKEGRRDGCLATDGYGGRERCVCVWWDGGKSGDERMVDGWEWTLGLGSRTKDLGLGL